MNLQDFIRRFSRNTDTVSALVASVGSEQASWRPAPDKWSIVEVVNHLCDEEREDFRMRLGMVLHKPGEEWPPIDPQGWPVERKYNERDLGESLERWLGERKNTIEWLERLETPNWDASYMHPQLGTIRAGDLLTSWICHDFLHICQLGRLQYEYIKHLAAPYSSAYAAPL